MKPSIWIVALIFIFNAPFALAQQTDNPSSGDEVSVSSMKQALEEMQTLLEKSSKSDAAEERHQLARKHRQRMRDATAMMSDMGMRVNQGKDHAHNKRQKMGKHHGGQGKMPMMQRMEDMQAHMEKMMQTKDPVERQKLMTEHREKMHKTMAMMRGMNKSSGQSAHGMRHQISGERGMMMTGFMAAFQQMDKRLDLMQMLLEREILE